MDSNSSCGFKMISTGLVKQVCLGNVVYFTFCEKDLSKVNEVTNNNLKTLTIILYSVF